MAAQTPWPVSKKKNEPIFEKTPKGEIEETLSAKTPQHEINKTAVIVGVVSVVALLFMTLR